LSRNTLTVEKVIGLFSWM